MAPAGCLGEKDEIVIVEERSYYGGERYIDQPLTDLCSPISVQELRDDCEERRKKITRNSQAPQE